MRTFFSLSLMTIALAACGGDASLTSAPLDAAPYGDAPSDMSAPSDAQPAEDAPRTPDGGDAAPDAADSGAGDATLSDAGNGAIDDSSFEADSETSTDAPDGGDASDGSSVDGAADAAPSCADGGVLDVTFGACGIFSTSAPADQVGAASVGIDAILVQGNGKIVAGGIRLFSSNEIVDPYLLRILPDGSGVDPTFASGGILTLSPYTGRHWLHLGVVQQADGALLVASACPTSDPAKTLNDVCVSRFSAEGVPDATFGSSGVAHVSTAATEDDSVETLALDTQGRALLAGYASTGTPSHDYPFIVRLTAAGVVDPTFHGGAPFMGPTPSPGGSFDGIGSLSTGRIFYALDSALGALTSSGTPDGTIQPGADSGASSFVPLPSDFGFGSFVVSPNDSSYAFGYHVFDGGAEPSVVKVAPEGALDPTFGDGGEATFPSLGTGFYGAALLGSDFYATNGGVVAKIGADGSLRTAWGSSGSVDMSVVGPQPAPWSFDRIGASPRGALVPGSQTKVILLARLPP